MEKLNQLEIIAKSRADNFEPCTFADTKDILAIAEAFRALEQRAEAAEAKLAELEKQEPYGYVAESPCSSGYGGMMHEFSIDRLDAEHDANQAEGFVIELFTRPAPAASLTDLVPKERSYDHYIGSRNFTTMDEALKLAGEWNACRAAILRNIEEANK